VTAPHPDLPAEQAYLDHAYACLDRMRALVERAPHAIEGEFAALAMERWSAKRLETFLDAERGLCFGRLDVEGRARPLYIGRRWVHDDVQDVVVVNWQAPAARPFYTATPVDPQHVTLRRRFKVEARRLLEIYDEPLGGSEGDEPAPVADVLLDELQRSREPRMRDIVATIQADQYRLITRDIEGALLIQQISFRVNTLPELIEFYQKFVANDVRFDIVVSHGNAFGIYFFDPEGNRAEVYWQTGLPARQPFLARIDLTQPIPTLLAHNAELVDQYGATGYLEPGLVDNLIPDEET